MARYDKILVPTDFSAAAAAATRAAADLATRFEARVTLVHVYDPFAYALPDGFDLLSRAAIEKLYDAFRSQLAAAQGQLLSAGVRRVDTQILQGFVASEIIEFANRGEIDLIVMGTHGRTGLGHFVMGSIAERVVRLAPCPVLTFKAKEGARAA